LLGGVAFAIVEEGNGLSPTDGELRELRTEVAELKEHWVAGTDRFLDRDRAGRTFLTRLIDDQQHLAFVSASVT